MRCPQCGYQPVKGRPKVLDDKRIISMHRQGWSLQEIADVFHVTRSAIQASLKRSA